MHTYLAYECASSDCRCGMSMQPISAVHDAHFPHSLCSPALPLIEIAGFVVVGRQIGVLPTSAWSLLTGVAGVDAAALPGLRRPGRAFSAETRAPGATRAANWRMASMILLAGVLLLIPGFVTDILGLLLFMPPVRDLGWRFLQQPGQSVGGFRPAVAASARRTARHDQTIDLDDGRLSSDARPQFALAAGTDGESDRLAPSADRRQTCLARPRHASQRAISIGRCAAADRGTAHGQQRRTRRGRSNGNGKARDSRRSTCSPSM